MTNKLPYQNTERVEVVEMLGWAWSTLLPTKDNPNHQQTIFSIEGLQLN